MKARRILSFLLVFVMASSVGFSLPFLAAGDDGIPANAPTGSNNIVVATDGNDAIGDGTVQNPFATLNRAKLEVRTRKTTVTGQINVYLCGGSYDMSSGGVSFTSADSGADGAEIVYQAYPGETPKLIGGKSIPANLVQKADASVSAKLTDTFAQTKLMQINLVAAGVDKNQFPPLDDYGFYNNIIPATNNEYKGFMTVFMNGYPLTPARWPNNDPGTAYLYLSTKPGDWFSGTAGSGGFGLFSQGRNDNPDNETNINYRRMVTDRIANWDTFRGDIFLEGYPGADYDHQHFKLASLDKTTGKFTTSNYWYDVSYTGGTHVVFFTNILEEIDSPGECYYDHNSGMLYFYPVGDTTNPDIMVSTLTNSMIDMNNTKYVEFNGIMFESSIERPIRVTAGDHITFDGVTVAHSSQNGMSLDGTYITVKNSHIYDCANGGIFINGGDRMTLSPSNDIIENCRIHSVNRVNPVYSSPVFVEGVGTLIQNCNLYDCTMTAVNVDGYGANDMWLDKNEIYRTQTQGSDFGTIYWGRNISQMGFKITNNYFHDIGNIYGGNGQCAIMWDDLCVGPVIEGNIFYRATRTTDQRGSSNNNFAIKTNGGAYSNVRNNIFVDVPNTAYYMRWWMGGSNVYNINTGELIPAIEQSPPEQYVDWWLYNINKWENWDGSAAMNTWYPYINALNGSVWQDHYAGTVWAPLTQGMFTQANIDECAPYNRFTDRATLHAIAAKYAPVNTFTDSTNKFIGNVAVAVDQGKPNGSPVSLSNTNNGGVAQVEKYWRSDTTVGTFVGTINTSVRPKASDFKLTANANVAALTATGFDFNANIPFDQIGIHQYSKDDAQFYPGGVEPGGSDARILKNADNTLLTAAYAYSSPCGAPEGATKYAWYVADSAAGPWTRISGRDDVEIPADGLMGKYVKCEITPYDVNMLYSELPLITTMFINIENTPYTVTYNANGATGGTVPVDSNSPYYNGENVTVLGNTRNLVREGYTFEGWTTDLNGSGTVYTAGNTFLMDSVDVTFYAKWSKAAQTRVLNVTAPTFSDAIYGYVRPDAAAITIQNSGNSAANISSVTVSDTETFEIGGSGAAVEAGGSIDTWTVQPKAGLAQGKYTAVITVTYDGDATAAANVSFTVNEAIPVKPEIKNVEVSGNSVTVSLTRPQPPAILFVAVYDNDKLIDVKLITALLSDEITVNNINLTGANKIKTMMWDGINILRPLCPPKTVIKNGGNWVSNQ